jgi:hypothetical protein
MDVKDEIVARIDKLPPERQQQALRFVTSSHREGPTPVLGFQFQRRRHYRLKPVGSVAAESHPEESGARIHACRIDTCVDALESWVRLVMRREKSRRGTHECVRHMYAGSKGVTCWKLTA